MQVHRQFFALSVVLVLSSVFGMVAHVQAAQVQLAWNDLNNNPADVGGYTLYYWQDTWQTPARLDIGKQLTYTLTGLEAG